MLAATNKPIHSGHGIGIDISPLVNPIIAFIFPSSVFSEIGVWKPRQLEGIANASAEPKQDHLQAMGIVG